MNVRYAVAIAGTVMISSLAMAQEPNAGGKSAADSTAASTAVTVDSTTEAAVVPVTATPANQEKTSVEKKRPRLFAAPTRKSTHVLPPHSVPDMFPIVIPAGIIFGIFQKEDGPFLIDGSVTVPSGQILQFGPGCQIYLGGKYSTITVFGQMIAKGTEDEPIIFQSANKDPNPWDWDRIYCRSKNRSEFSYCVFRHSNYGLDVENGMAAIDNCTFEYNSLHGLVVRNSSVSIRNSLFNKGHVLAVFLEAGASVVAESLMVKDNITGIACADKATLKMSGGEISGNTNGLVWQQNASVSIVAGSVTGNRNGVVATTEIPRKMSEMVYDNAVNSRVVADSKIAELFKAPEEVKSVVLPKTKTTVQVFGGFEPGFSATRAPRESQTSFIGNVSLGFKYYLPKSYNDDYYDTTFDTASLVIDAIDKIDTSVVYQTRYPGEGSDNVYAGLQPETQLFMSGRHGGADVNFLADFYGNQWSGFRKNMLNLSMTFADQEIVVGDFYENGNETSISGRKLTGIKLHGQALDMGRGVKRLGFKLAGGETEFPKDSGDNEIDLYNEVVDSSMAVRQQLTYIAEMDVKPTYNSTVIIKGLIARDQADNPFLREALSTSGPKPIEAQSGAIGGEVTLLEGNLIVGAEIDLGSHDTLDNDDQINWYNPEIPQSIQRVFSNFTDKNYFAGTFNADATVAGVDLGLVYTEIRPSYFSAGNPYLESDRRVFDLNGERQLTEKVVINGNYEFQESYVSNKLSVIDNVAGPQSTNTLGLMGKLEMGEKKPSFTLDYSLGVIGQQQVGEKTKIEDGDTLEPVNNAFSSRELKNQLGIQYKQHFNNDMDLTLKYRTAITSDVSDYSPIDAPASDDEYQHLITARHTFKIKRIVTNKTNMRLALKTKTDGDFFGYQYKISDQIRTTIIPRKLVLNLKGEYGRRLDEEDVSEGSGRIATETKFYAVDGDIKLTLTSKLSLTVLGKYEVSRDGNNGSADNYNMTMGGMSVTYLF